MDRQAMLGRVHATLKASYPSLKVSERKCVLSHVHSRLKPSYLLSPPTLDFMVLTLVKAMLVEGDTVGRHAVGLLIEAIETA